MSPNSTAYKRGTHTSSDLNKYRINQISKIIMNFMVTEKPCSKPTHHYSCVFQECLLMKSPYLEPYARLLSLSPRLSRWIPAAVSPCARVTEQSPVGWLITAVYPVTQGMRLVSSLGLLEGELVQVFVKRTFSFSRVQTREWDHWATGRACLTLREMLHPASPATSEGSRLCPCQHRVGQDF